VTLGHIRPWRLNAAVTALRSAFPGAKVHIRHYDPRDGFADFVVSQPLVITEDTREPLTTTTSWAPRRLRIAAEVLNACEHEAAIAALIAIAVPKMERGAVVEIGDLGRATSRNLIRQAQAQAKTWKEDSRASELRPEPDRQCESVGVAEPAAPGVVIRNQTGHAPPLIARGPRLGRRVPEKELRTLLRGVVLREGVGK